MINGTFYEIGGGGMPFLNYGTPVHTFSTSGSFTATKDCYLVGDISMGAVVKIDNTTVAEYSDSVSVSIQGSPSYIATVSKSGKLPVPMLPIKQGQVVGVSGTVNLVMLEAL